jgi:Helicase conserved C-terminal domain
MDGESDCRSTSCEKGICEEDHQLSQSNTFGRRVCEKRAARHRISYHLRDYVVRHVNGEQSSGERREHIRAFADAKKGLLTNARCLTEGIDIPAFDMIVFIDRRQSKVDITQAVGRAMRKPRGPTTKTVGYVVVPLFVDKSKDDEQSVIHSEGFETLIDVFNAMQEHDEDLVDIIREIRERKGAGKSFNPRRLNEKLSMVGPFVDFDRLTRSIEVEIADRIGINWDEWVGVLRRFKSREGHCAVPRKHREGILRLGEWSVYSAILKTQCLLNADSGWMQSDLFGTHTKALGTNGLDCCNVSKNARDTATCLLNITKELLSWGNGSSLNARSKTPQCQMNANIGLVRLVLFGTHSKPTGKKDFLH